MSKVQTDAIIDSYIWFVICIYTKVHKYQYIFQSSDTCLGSYVMIRVNGYAYSQKYRDILDNDNLANQRFQINEKTKKLCLENKKRRRLVALHLVSVLSYKAIQCPN